MKAINLEQELLLSNKKENEDGLILKEAKAILEKAADDDVTLLSQMGLDHSIEKYKEINNKTSNLDSIIENLDKNRVFTVEQIKNVANKYRLKFLPTHLYKGNVDPVLTVKVKEFDEAVSKNNPSFIKDLKYNQRQNKNSYYIMAPASEFELQERSKDPLCFIKLDDENYYLVHKWGNDLSEWRRITSWFKNYMFFVGIAIFASVGIALALYKFYIDNSFQDLSVLGFIGTCLFGGLVSLFVGLVVAFYGALLGMVFGGPSDFNYDSNFKN